MNALRIAPVRWVRATGRNASEPITSRMTDHRINLTLYKLDQVMQGDLDDVIDALTADDQARLLAEMAQ